MKKIIINADDCGISKQVDESIEKAIIRGKITSTTVMANMDDFEGAVRLYKKYGDRISFGWHINLTEGEPLTQSQLLLEKGFFKEDEGKIFLNAQAFRKNLITGQMAKEIKRELHAQYEKIRDNGIDISHADGHHHIHTATSMIMIMPSLFKELNIGRCRRLKTYGTSGLSFLGRKLWAIPFKIRGIKTTDTFGEFATYSLNPSLNQGSTIELECHPGHPNPKYIKEMEIMDNTNTSTWNAIFITYKQL